MDFHDSLSTSNAASAFSDVLKKERSVIGELRKDSIQSGSIGEKDYLGLALSGGGIRSATFSLGILQALADFSLLRHVDYLSTVSGGGYIGSWLIARLKQNEKSIDQLEKNLSPLESPDPNTQAWEPIQFLRAYSNYLTPQLGFFSADTWSIAAIWLRNTILMQSILMLALAAIVLSPRWIYLGPDILIGLPVWGRILPWTAIALVVSGSAFGLRKFGGSSTPKQWQVLFTVVFPLFALCCYAAMMIYKTVQASWLQPVYAAVVVSVSMLIVQEGGQVRSKTAREALPLWQLLFFTLCSGGLAGILTYSLIQISTAATDTWIVMTVGPVLVVAALSFVLTCHIGLLSRALEDGQREWVSRAGAWLNICAACWFTLFFTAIYAPLLMLRLDEWFQAALPALTIGWVVSTAAGLFSAWSAKSGGSGTRAQSLSLKLIATYAPYVFVTGLLFLLSFTLHVVLARYAHPGGQPLFESWSGLLSRDGFIAIEAQYWDLMAASGGAARWLVLSSIGLFMLALVLSRRFDLNEFSMHYFYKNRLIRCYLGAARKQRQADRFTGFDPNDDIQLSEVTRRPYPIVNASLNLVHGKRLAWQERKATSFVLTPEYCGFYRSDKSPKERRWLAESAYRPTSKYGGKVYLGTAIAISGAAVNPNMGSFTSPATAFLMTVFNVRLGSWLGNPRHEWTWNRSSPKTGIFYLLCELIGATNDERGFVNVSDGGHFENLGIYELVRRRCKYIICCDGSQDSAFAFEDLGNAIRKCRSDFGAEIEIDVNQILPGAETGRSRAHCAVGYIQYPRIQRPDGSALEEASIGYLVYIKTSLTGDEPADVLEYRKLHPGFPHQTTADQWFTESQFESYRRLGYHIGRKVFEGSMENVKRTPPESETAMEVLFKDLQAASSRV